MTINNQDSLARIENFLAELTKLSLETGVKVGLNKKTTFITEDDNLDGRYELENSHCFGFNETRSQ